LTLNAIGVFGGTFDPVHIGHLRTALELRETLSLQRMLLIPSARPPHREQPGVSALDRLAMLAAAIGDEPGLIADDRELHRSGPSYTIDTLAELRAEVGPATALCLCVGMDSLVTLTSWRRWRELTDFAHLVVAARPGWQLPVQGEVADWLVERRCDTVSRLHGQTAGLVLIQTLTLLPVSATQLRADLAAGRSTRYLVPDAALAHIRAHGLYRSAASIQKSIQNEQDRR
jgi:nicotinate-nucleotide adenylyltransferase